MLCDIFKNILEVSRSEYGIRENTDEWIALDHLFFNELSKATIQDIINSLDLDENYEAPSYMVIEMHQKLLLLDESRRESFEDFAYYLRGCLRPISREFC